MHSKAIAIKGQAEHAAQQWGSRNQPHMNNLRNMGGLEFDSRRLHQFRFPAKLPFVALREGGLFLADRPKDATVCNMHSGRPLYISNATKPEVSC